MHAFHCSFFFGVSLKSASFLTWCQWIGQHHVYLFSTCVMHSRCAWSSSFLGSFLDNFFFWTACVFWTASVFLEKQQASTEKLSPLYSCSDTMLESEYICDYREGREKSVGVEENYIHTSPSITMRLCLYL